MTRRAAGVFLLAFAVWPLLQHGLVRAFDVDPWKLGGLGMYARATLPPEVALFEVRAGQRVALAPEALSAEDGRRLADFARDRGVWGRLLPPTRLLRGCLRERPGAEAMELVVTTWRLDGDARLRRHDRVYWEARGP